MHQHFNSKIARGPIWRLRECSWSALGAHLGGEECGNEVEGNDEKNEAVQVLDGQACLKAQLLQRALPGQELQQHTEG